MKTPTNAKELLDCLHHNYMKRRSCTVRFRCAQGAAVLVMKNGDIICVQGDHFDQGRGFMELLRGGATDIVIQDGMDTTPGHEISTAMEMILFEMAAGMDVEVNSTLDNVRKTGKLPPELVEDAVTGQVEADPASQQQIYLLEEGETVIGRSSAADLVVIEPTMSRKHAKVNIYNRAASVENLSTANGTFVNRRLVDASPLEEGNLLSLGKSVFRFFWSDCGRGILFRINDDSPRPEDMATLKIPG
ncbi:MAG: FHA domain-containing protein [Verrucomicrobiota bacterium]